MPPQHPLSPAWLSDASRMSPPEDGEEDALTQHQGHCCPPGLWDPSWPNSARPLKGEPAIAHSGGTCDIIMSLRDK